MLASLLCWWREQAEAVAFGSPALCPLPAGDLARSHPEPGCAGTRGSLLLPPLGSPGNVCTRTENVWKLLAGKLASRWEAASAVVWVNFVGILHSDVFC